MVDLYGQYEELKAEIDAGMRSVIAESAFINGPAVGAFARELSDYLGVRHTLPCGNGTDALILALMAIGLAPGDEVIVPAFTYAATAEAVALLGGVPVMADVDPATFGIDPESIRRLVSPRTRAIIPVHLFGQPCDMEEILRIAGTHGLRVIEDNAQSLGSEVVFSDGTRRFAGTVGDIGCTSFFPTKVLGCFGDGGALFTDDDRLAERIRCLASHGQSAKYRHETVGFNSRLDTLQAAVLRAKLPRLDEHIARRRAAAQRYTRRLKHVAGVAVPAEAPGRTHVWGQYTLKIADGKRDGLRRRLEAAGIPTMIYYPQPLFGQPAAQHMPCLCDSRMQAARLLPECVLSLPMHPCLTADQQETITDEIERYFHDNS